MKKTGMLLTLAALCMAATPALAMTATASIQIDIAAPAAPTITSNNPGPDFEAYYVEEEIVLTADSDDATSYAWYKDGTPLSETGATLTLTSAAASDNGVYTAVAINDCGDESAASNAITVAVYDRVMVEITASPEAVEGNHASCTDITLTANVPGTLNGPLTYQWSLNGTPISGATAATYLVAPATSTQSGNYSVVVTDNMGREPMTP